MILFHSSITSNCWHFKKMLKTRIIPMEGIFINTNICQETAEQFDCAVHMAVLHKNKVGQKLDLFVIIGDCSSCPQHRTVWLISRCYSCTIFSHVWLEFYVRHLNKNAISVPIYQRSMIFSKQTTCWVACLSSKRFVTGYREHTTRTIMKLILKVFNIAQNRFSETSKQNGVE